jgi:hypothetical protein
MLMFCKLMCWPLSPEYILRPKLMFTQGEAPRELSSRIGPCLATKFRQEWQHKVTVILTFLTFAIPKFKTLKFWICSNETEILHSSLESAESRQSTLQLHESQVLYHYIFWNIVSFVCRKHQLTRTKVLWYKLFRVNMLLKCLFFFALFAIYHGADSRDGFKPAIFWIKVECSSNYTSTSDRPFKNVLPLFRSINVAQLFVQLDYEYSKNTYQGQVL